jgi:peptidoglycan/xylan/chitin deacetylase (PgdA/CDA1 family)
MAGPRVRAERALDRVGVLDRLLWLRARFGRRDLAIFTYHRTGEVEAAGELDPGVFDTTPSDLAQQLEVLRAHATIVSLADVRRFVRGGRRPPNPVLVSFDDGYVDVETALPILRRAGVPATFFIPTAFPGAGRLFWWDRIWVLLHRARRETLELAYPTPLVLHPARALAPAARALVAAVKHTERLDLGRLWEELETAAGVTLDATEERAIASRTLLSWQAIRRLRDAGMDVQSHSHAHVVLNALTPALAREDLERSARILTDQMGEAPFAVAFPVGYELGPAHRNVAREAGFELGFTNGTGLASLDRADPFNLPRISMELGLGTAGFKALMLLGDARWARPTWIPMASNMARPEPSPASEDARTP